MSVINTISDKAKPSPEGIKLIEQLVERKNMEKAYWQVVRNKGAAGIDNMTVEQLKPYLQTNWAETKEKLLSGNYKPRPVREVEIPKATGGKRTLCIPTVIDRLIQQSIHQILSPIFESTFSEFSYGFREGRSAHQAILQAKKYQQEGRRYVVDMDIEKFFDEVNHDILMSGISRKVKEREILRLIRRYLQSGVMKGGIQRQREKGTPQGSPLSPLLSNIMLDELDKELEKRGHKFCRYADDCNIYVGSEKAGQRVLNSISKFLEKKLKLKVNRTKSGVAKAYQRKFLGYSFTWDKQPRIRVAKESIQRFRKKVKELLRKARGRNIGNYIKEELTPLIRGWINYFKLSEVKNFAEELDGWIRRRLRLIIWKQWKRPWTRKEKLMKAGLNEERAVMSAFNRRGSWWNSGASHMNEAFRKKYFESLGLVSMLEIILCYQK
jgi:RNA-directed DNA polymerase